MITMLCTPGLGPNLPGGNITKISKELLSYCDYWVFMWYSQGGDTYSIDQVTDFLTALDKNGDSAPAGSVSRLKFDTTPSLSLIKDKLIFGNGNPYSFLDEPYQKFIHDRFNGSTMTWCTRCPMGQYPKGCGQ